MLAAAVEGWCASSRGMPACAACAWAEIPWAVCALVVSAAEGWTVLSFVIPAQTGRPCVVSGWSEYFVVWVWTVEFGVGCPRRSESAAASAVATIALRSAAEWQSASSLVAAPWK